MRAHLVYVGWLGVLQRSCAARTANGSNGVRWSPSPAFSERLTVLVYRLGVWRQEMENTKKQRGVGSNSTASSAASRPSITWPLGAMPDAHRRWTGSRVDRTDPWTRRLRSAKDCVRASVDAAAREERHQDARMDIPVVFSMSRVIVLAFAIAMFRQIWRAGIAGWPDATLAIAIVLALPMLGALERVKPADALEFAKSLISRFGVGGVRPERASVYARGAVQVRRPPGRRMRR